MRTRGRLLLVVLPIVAGVAIRLVYLWAVHRTQCPAPWWEGGTGTTRCPGDSQLYHYGANLVADGKGFVLPTDFRYSGGLIEKAGADHPPLFTLFLAAFSWLGATSWLWHEHVVILLGALNIGLTGVLGRRLGGIWVGFVAAMFMAVYPAVWLSDVMVMSETLAMTLVLVVALLAYQVVKDPSWAWVVALGAAAGGAALVRAEMLLLGPLLVLPLLLRVSSLSLRQQLLRVGAAALAMLAVLSPWLFRNLTLYNQPVTMSTGTGITLSNTNCDDTYYTERLGYWSFSCVPRMPWTRPEAELRTTDQGTLELLVRQSGLSAPEGATSDELVDLILAHGETADQSDDEVYLRSVGIDYIKDNASRLPVVMAARFGRMWNLYRPLQQVELEDDEGRPTAAAEWGLPFFYPLMLAAAGGVVVLWRRRQTLIPLLAPVAIVSIAAITAFGQSRYRAPVEPMLLTLAAVGFVALVQWWRRRSKRVGTDGDDRADGLVGVGQPT
jgi:hypothetical protein